MIQFPPSVEEEDRRKYNHNAQGQPEENFCDKDVIGYITTTNYTASHRDRENFEVHIHHIGVQILSQKISLLSHHHITSLPAFFNESNEDADA